MAAMIRKQLYIEDKQERKLKALSRRWGCTEAEVVRKAIDRLADPDDLDSLIVQRLSDAGLLVPPPPYEPPPDLRQGETLDEWEERTQAWLDEQPPMGLGEAVLEERRSGW